MGGAYPLLDILLGLTGIGLIVLGVAVWTSGAAGDQNPVSGPPRTAEHDGRNSRTAATTMPRTMWSVC